VPDWHTFQRFPGSTTEYFGLWAYCQEQGGILGTVCQRWSAAEVQLFNGSRPEFVRTSEGLITTGMIFLSLGLGVALLALILPLIAYLAAFLALIAFVFLVVGLPIFGRQSNDFSAQRGDAVYYKRYGFWLMVPTIVLEFLAILFFLGAGVLYKLCGYGNMLAGMGNSSGNYSNKPYGGQQVLGPPNVLSLPAAANIPYRMPPPPMMPYEPPPPPIIPYGIPPPAFPFPSFVETEPTLLSQYLAQSLARPYSASLQPPMNLGRFPQPSFLTPSNLQPGQPYGPSFTPIINLTGETLVGPIQRTA
jgi:hypothetical protein